MTYFLIGLGGALGATLRFYFSNYFSQFVLFSIPLGTFLVNLLGCFLVGYFISNQEEEHAFFINNFFAIGFLGAFTTFSAFTKEAFVFYNDESFLIFLVYIFFTVLTQFFFSCNYSNLKSNFFYS